ncbi:LLM class flavin-dependent oxidoreductase [Nocardioides sp. QY071]|uniref:LLM class flavin-dependent oxidoreductase n=1 Tax=Nocardioides sp. QY071 TaxID=3044187 RepID=UPI00249CEA6C|nr:LLM class flavin-dependent oxidoreductase [Nocardioides sp. QY071]WGY01819.1 LLM class flavin-dependent oxidoreductase [Nocardioides sp. QY071]
MHIAMAITQPDSLGGWRREVSRAAEFSSLDYWVEIAQVAERGKLDALFIADAPVLELPSRPRQAPKLEPIGLLSALAARTSRIGLVGTSSTTYNEPYTLARQFATLDHLSNGRAGWNIVTSFLGTRNYGVPLAAQPDRYARAEEFIEVATALWDSIADDALLVDKASGIYTDVTKVHPINHSGGYFNVEGPLDVSRSPQGRPVLVQAGASATGRDFAARYAEVIFSAAPNISSAQEFYGDMRRRIAAAGRDPGQVKLLPGCSTFIGSTEEEACRIRDEAVSLMDVDYGLIGLQEELGGVDLSGLDLDEPIPVDRLPEDTSALVARQSRPQLFKELALTPGYTLRRMIETHLSHNGHWNLVGSPEQIADSLQEWFTNEACDGIMLVPAHTPDGIEIFVDEVVPILQRRGLFRMEYKGNSLRDHLGLQRPDMQRRDGRS